jgi:hypothetical protein
MASAPKFVLPIPIFLAYLVPLDVDVTGYITAKLCEVWSEFKKKCTLVTMVTATILKSPLFLFLWQLRQSLSNRFRFFLAYLIPLDVDIVPIKFHQFLFGE